MIINIEGQNFNLSNKNSYINNILISDSLNIGLGFSADWQNNFSKNCKYKKINEFEKGSPQRVYFKKLGIAIELNTRKVLNKKDFKNRTEVTRAYFIFKDNVNLVQLFGVENIKKLGKPFSGSLEIRSFSIDKNYTLFNFRSDFKEYIVWQVDNPHSVVDANIELDGFRVSFEFIEGVIAGCSVLRMR